MEILEMEELEDCFDRHDWEDVRNHREKKRREKEERKDYHKEARKHIIETGKTKKKRIEKEKKENKEGAAAGTGTGQKFKSIPKPPGVDAPSEEKANSYAPPTWRVWQDQIRCRRVAVDSSRFSPHSLQNPVLTGLWGTLYCQPRRFSLGKDLTRNAWHVRKTGRGMSCSRSWVKHGDWEGLSMVCNFAWQRWSELNGRPEPYNPHPWMRDHPWKAGDDSDDE
jgi:hypothetical protein